MPTVTLRFFAAARAAAGTSESDVSGPDPLSIDAALELVSDHSGDYRDVVSRCSFLVGGVATTDRGRILGPGDVVDVLPPFAGG